MALGMKARYVPFIQMKLADEPISFTTDIELTY